MTFRTKDWNSYETLAGETLRYPPPPPDVERYLRRVRDAAADPEVGEDEMIELVYARENPVLDPTLFAERGAVTPRVFADPLYTLLCDLLARKRVQLGTLDLAATAARYTMTVGAAAERLGKSPSEVGAMMRDRRLGFWVKDGVSYLDPEAVDTHRAHDPGSVPSSDPAVRVRFGQREGASFRVKAVGLVVEGKRKLPGGSVCDGQVPTFAQMAIAFSGQRMNRMFIIEPAPEEASYTFYEFGLTGRFRIVEKINDPAEASARFRLFRPA